MRPHLPETEDERIRLIGDLLCKGILLSPSLRGDAVGVGESPTVDRRKLEPEQRIVDYLRRHRAASPAEMRTVLNLSRSRTYRALQQLLASRLVVTNGGRTTAAAYRLADLDPSRN
jgi:AraC-like DNA-binding protein